MSRRETAVNVLLGCTLVLIFAILVFLFVIPAVFVFDFLSRSTTAYFAHLGVSDHLWFCLLACSLAVWNAVCRLRKHVWINALLSLALIPSMILPSLPEFFSTQLDQRNLPFALLLLCMIPLNGHLQRWEVLLFTFLIALVTALSAGFVAPASLRVAEDGLLFGTAAWVVVRVRRGDLPMQKANS